MWTIVETMVGTMAWTSVGPRLEYGRSTRSLESGFFFTPFFTAYSSLGWAVPVREYLAVYVPSSQLILQYVVIFELCLFEFCRIAVVSYR